jgi:hypothetical protein
MGSDIGYESKFNEAALKMKRLHESQDLINSLSVNPLMFNQMVGKYNYEIICSENLTLLQEVWGKLGKTEKVDGERWRTLLITTLEVKPIHTIEYDEGFGGLKKRMKFNDDNWKFLREIMFKFSLIIREYLDKHGMSTPNITDEGGWD